MSRRNNILATFERQNPALDYFSGEVAEWVTVTKAWGSFSVSDQVATGGEQLSDAQVTNLRTSTFVTIWTPAVAAVDSACRMRIGDRTFGIDRITNVDEQNRQIRMRVVERV